MRLCCETHCVRQFFAHIAGAIVFNELPDLIEFDFGFEMFRVYHLWGYFFCLDIPIFL